MILVNVPSEHWETIQEGMEALKKVKLTNNAAENPYDDDDVEHDYWKLGFMAAEHGWDVEW